MNLHELNPRHPYDHIPCLTERTFNELLDFVRPDRDEDDEDGDWVTGDMRDLWHEDDRAYGLWQDRDSHDEYVVRLTEYDYNRRWPIPRENQVTYRAQMQERDGSWGWDIYNDFILDARAPFQTLDRLES